MTQFNKNNKKFANLYVKLKQQNMEDLLRGSTGA